MLGCTDPTATNYDPLATHSDSSCTYTPVSYGTEIIDSSAGSFTGNLYKWGFSGGNPPQVINNELASTGGGGNVYYAFTPTHKMTAGLTYRLTMDVTAGAHLDLIISSTQTSTVTPGINKLSLVSGTQYEAIFVFTPSNSWYASKLYFKFLDTNITVDNVSLREIL